MAILIRNVEKGDEKAVIDICYETGDEFMHKLLPDPYLFGLCWAIYYVRHESPHSFVAVDEETHKVVGYIMCAPDTRLQEEQYKKVMYPLMKQRMKELKIRSLPTKSLIHFLTHKKIKGKKIQLLKEYPAHLHIDILPGYQRRGIGHQLMNALMSHLANSNVSGIHLGVGGSNHKGVAFYEKYGFKLLRKQQTALTYGKKTAEVHEN